MLSPGTFSGTTWIGIWFGTCGQQDAAVCLLAQLPIIIEESDLMEHSPSGQVTFTARKEGVLAAMWHHHVAV